MNPQRTGFAFAILAFTIFASQDAISKYLSASYSPVVITMFRYWAFGAFAITLAARSRGGLRASLKTSRPWIQILRGVLLSTQIMVTILSFRIAGLVQSQSIFSATPLVVAMLSVPVLGEVVGWRRWTAIAVGMVGVLIILNPNPATFDLSLLIPVLSATMMAVYSICTRLAGRTDTAMTSFFYTGIVGSIVASLAGLPIIAPMAGWDWAFMGLLCATGIASHFCLIKAYDYLDAVVVQPLSYYQLVLSAFIGVLVFHEALKPNVVAGSVIIVAAGLFTIWREAVKRRELIRRAQSSSSSSS